MASTVLPNGIIIPEKYSRDWYADLYHNWQELDNLLGGGTPKDGTLTIQKNGSTVGTFSANQATDETIDITVPDVNNGTLTIQQNGTTVDTFTANSSSDKTVNIQCVDLNSNQTVPGSKEFTGTTTAHDVIPSATNTYNLGRPSYQWNNAYIKSLTINGVACGDILTHNASEFVDVSSNQTIGGVKTFGSLASKSNTLERGSLPTTIVNEDPIFISVDKNNRRTLAFFNYYYPNGDGKVVLYTYNQNTTNYDNIGLVFSFSNQANIKSVYPSITETYNLGTSTNKWKTFNGINPGALSLPSISSSGANAWIALDTTDWVKSPATSAAQKYTPPADGWLNIRVNNATMLGLAITGGGNYMHQMVRSETPNGLALLIPVFKNVEVAILVAGNENLVYDRSTFYYCQGNV